MPALHSLPTTCWVDLCAPASDVCFVWLGTAGTWQCGPLRDIGRKQSGSVAFNRLCQHRPSLPVQHITLRRRGARHHRQSMQRLVRSIDLLPATCGVIPSRILPRGDCVVTMDCQQRLLCQIADFRTAPNSQRHGLERHLWERGRRPGDGGRKLGQGDWPLPRRSQPQSEPGGSAPHGASEGERAPCLTATSVARHWLVAHALVDEPRRRPKQLAPEADPENQFGINMQWNVLRRLGVLGVRHQARNCDLLRYQRGRAKIRSGKPQLHHALLHQHVVGDGARRAMRSP